MIPRHIIKKFSEYEKYFQIISLNGPGQSGKSTFIQNAVKDLPYVNLEAPDRRKIRNMGSKTFPATFSKRSNF